MSSVAPTARELIRMVNDADDQNVLSLRYKFLLTANQRQREIFKEILTGKPTSSSSSSSSSSLLIQISSRY